MDIAKQIRDGQNSDDMLRRALIPLIKLYADKSHFVYELLQNAEDTMAKRIKFIQYEDRLEVFHDGIPFTIQNLKALCDISNSDKQNNFNKIGEFGVGFKSVFCICDTVLLFSEPKNHPKGKDTSVYPPMSIKIVDFVTPENVTPDIKMPAGFTTRFVFPYKIGTPFAGFETEEALKEAIADRLKNLESNTLLFLKSLCRIEYEIKLSNSEANGNYELKKTVHDGYTFVEPKDPNQPCYYVFSQTVENEAAARCNRTIDIAFAAKKGANGTMDFVKVDKPYISVYFATETESKLDFIIQGPFRTMPNRSSVPADSENRDLVRQARTLFRRSITTFCQQKLMTLSLLNILPLYKDRFSVFNLFEPIHDEMLDILRTESILPCKSKGYTNTVHARLARSEELASLFSDEDLTSLFVSNETIHWLPTEISETSSLYKELHGMLVKVGCVPVIRPEELAEKFFKNPLFLPKKDSSWLIRMYKMYEKIPNVFATNKKGNKMLTSPFIKTLKGSFEAPYRTSSAGYAADLFVPPKDGHCISGVNYVAPGIYAECKEFFDVTLGLKPPDEYDFIIKPLKSRYVSSSPKVSPQDNLQDVKTILKYLGEAKYNGELRDFLQTSFRMHGMDNHGKTGMYKPSELIQKQSKEGFDIREFYLGVSASTVCFIDDIYSDEGITSEELCKLGVTNIMAKEVSVHNGYTTGHVNWSADFSYMLDVDGIEQALIYISSHKGNDFAGSLKKSSIIVKLLCEYATELTGKLKISGNTKDAHSIVIDKIIAPNKYMKAGGNWSWDGKWLLDSNNNWVAPSSISVDNLNQGYGEIDSSLKVFEEIGFKKSNAQVQKDIDETYNRLTTDQRDRLFARMLEDRFQVSIDDLAAKLKLLRRNATVNLDDETFEFPSVPVRNWDNLKVHVLDMMINASDVQYEQRLRSVRTSLKSGMNLAYISSNYGCNAQGKKACQLCHRARINVECAQLFNEMSKELSPLFLSLCPDCHRIYTPIRNNKFASDGLKKRIKEIRQQDIISSQEHIVIKIDATKELWFTQTHLAEIKEILENQ